MVPRRYTSVIAAITVAVTVAVAGCAPRPGSATKSPTSTYSAPAPTTAPVASTAPAAPTSTAGPPAGPATTAAADGRTQAGTAAAALATLAVKGRAPRTGYDRDLFGPAWADTDHNGCDTRNDVLNRDLSERTWRAGTRGCVVLSGVLADPYSGTTIAFTKANAFAVQIDHIVALSDAWQKGAGSWDADTRRRFANDPLNLLAVDGPLNQAKGDGDAATWLPPNKAARCSYVARQVAVKAAYGLWMTVAEHDAIARVLAGCDGETLPR